MEYHCLPTIADLNVLSFYGHPSISDKTTATFLLVLWIIEQLYKRACIRKWDEMNTNTN